MLRNCRKRRGYIKPLGGGRQRKGVGVTFLFMSVYFCLLQVSIRQFGFFLPDKVPASDQHHFPSTTSLVPSVKLLVLKGGLTKWISYVFGAVLKIYIQQKSSDPHLFSFWEFLLGYFCCFYGSAVIRTETFTCKQRSVIKKIQASRTNGRVLLLSGLAL